MKKVLALALGMLLIPFTAFGMQTMNEADMDSVTGQSGVAISIANIQVYNTGGDELWYRGGSENAAVGLVYGEETASYTFITSIKSLDENAVGAGTPEVGSYTRGNYDPINDGDLTYDGSNLATEMPALPRVLSIRVLEGDDSGMFGGADDAHIEIGLPTVEIVGAEGSVDALNLYIGSFEGEDSPIGLDEADDNMASMGTIYTSDSGSTTAIFGGAIGITSAGSGQVPGLIMDIPTGE